MNYYNETEKSLKRYLKSKVKITMATVVGFLICGSVAFGAWNDNANDFVNKINEIKKDEKSGIQVSTDTLIELNGVADLYVDPNYPPIIIGDELKNVITITGGTTTIGENTTISSSSNINLLNIYGAEAVNNGNLIKNNTIGGYEAINVNGYEKLATFTNNCTVEAKNGHAISIYKDGTVNNNGIIIGNIVGRDYDGSGAGSKVGTQTINLGKGSHIEGSILLIGTGDNFVNINGVNNGITETIDIQSGDVEVNINNSNVILTGNIGNENGAVITLNNENENNIMVNKATLVGETGIDIAGSQNGKAVVDVTNEGKIIASSNGIHFDGYFTKYNKVKITNEGEIEAKGSNERLSGIYVGARPNGEQAEVVNNNKILVTGSYTGGGTGYKVANTGIVGIRLHEYSTGINNGIVEVTGENSSGVALTAGAVSQDDNSNGVENYASFTNNNQIKATGKNTIGLLVRQDGITLDNPYKVTATNNENGSIIVSGEGAIGVKLTNKDFNENKPENSEKSNLDFTNNGTIELADGTTNGTGIYVGTGTATNNGIIKLGMDKKGNIAINNDGGTATNNGIIQVSDMSKEEIEAMEDFKVFNGTVDGKGLIVDENGLAVYEDDEAIQGGTIDTDVLDKVDEGKGSVTIKTGAEVEIEAGENSADLHNFTVNGKATIVGQEEVKISSDVINMASTGKMVVSADSKLSLSDAILNKVTGTGEGTFTEAIENNGTLNLTGMTVNGDIVGEGTVNAIGNNTLNGTFAGIYNIGGTPSKNLEKTSTTKLTSTSKFENGSAINIKTDGQLVLEVAENGDNALLNSSSKTEKVNEGVTITGDGTDGNGDILLDISNISGDEVKISLGNGNTFTDVDVAAELGENSIYTVNDDNLTSNGTVTVTYNKDIDFGNEKINAMHKVGSGVGAYLSKDTTVVGKQYDTLYSNNIYSETVKATYDNMKLNEETILSLNATPEVGKWVGTGKALYNKSQLDRDGLLGAEYSTEVETTGLLGAMEYGLNDTTSVGVAFSGALQDVDANGGNADGTLLYLGTYAKKSVGNYDFTAGLGYQYGDYDSDNTAGNMTSSTSYKSNSFSAYGQVKYVADFDTLRFEPKVRLGYTYVDQDDVKDNYFEVSDANMSTVDTTVGLDIVKEVSLSNSQLRVLAGVSFTKLFGDTDNEFVGSFGNGNFNVMGANLTENSLNFTLGAEVETEKGFFYNVGATYTMGSNNTENYGANLGIGYRF